MLVGLEELAAHMLGVFMIALACIPLVFVWQDHRRRQVERSRVAKLQHEARIAARLRKHGTTLVAPSVAENWLGEARR